MRHSTCPLGSPQVYWRCTTATHQQHVIWAQHCPSQLPRPAACCRCECPWGLSGPACATHELPACRLRDSSHLAWCGDWYPKSCECYRWGAGVVLPLELAYLPAMAVGCSE
jgi:hypothetical protein